MTKYILIFLMAGASLFAQEINPYAPVSRIESGAVVETQTKMPTRFGTTIKYDRAPHAWNGDGWVQAELLTKSNVLTNQIPAEIQQVAVQYKSVMEAQFGAGAVTNEALDRAYVTITMSLDTNVTADTGVRLRAWYEILSGYWESQSTTLFNFPYDQSEYVLTNQYSVFEPFLYVTPDAVEFGPVPAGQTVTNSIDLVNARTTAITGSVVLAASAFQTLSPGTFNLAPGTEQTFLFTFTATNGAAGSHTGTIQINSNAGSYSNEISAQEL